MTDRLNEIKELRKKGPRIFCDWEKRIDWLLDTVQAERDQKDDAHLLIQMVADKLGVAVEPHQTFNDRLLTAAEGMAQRPDAFGPMRPELTMEDFEDRYILVTEQEHPDWLKSDGPIVWETAIRHANILGAIKRAKSVGSKYGRRLICKLVPFGTPEEVESAAKDAAW